MAAGGVITFDCGPAPVTIAMQETAKLHNDRGPDTVIDGGGRVTLSGAGVRRILYMNTCDRSLVWTTSHCNDQDHPRLTVQHLTFVDGNATGETIDGGGAIRVLDQFQDLPVVVAGSTFGSAGNGNSCSNGGALSSIGVSWSISGSVFRSNTAVGRGANPQRGGRPGGGSGGAIYLDGNRFTLELRSTTIEGNHANEGGGAVFFVSNDRTGTMRIESSRLVGNPNDGFSTSGLPGIFYLGNGWPALVDSTLA